MRSSASSSRTCPLGTGCRRCPSCLAEGTQPPRYRFLLARLGTLTTVDVPAGQGGRRALPGSDRQQLGSREDEVQRCHLLLRRSLEGLARVLGGEAAREAALSVSREVGGPESTRLAQATARGTVSGATRWAAERLRRDFDARYGSSTWNAATRSKRQAAWWTRARAAHRSWVRKSAKLGLTFARAFTSSVSAMGSAALRMVPRSGCAMP